MTPTLSTEVLVIGGGAPGAGVAWGCAPRGSDTALGGRRDLAEGTSGRFHGLLHSGGRYAVKDPDAAVECVEENAILRRIPADCIQDTGGGFGPRPGRAPPPAPRLPSRGARILPYHRVTEIVRDGDAVVGARMHDERSGEDVAIEAQFVLNASGAWAGHLAAMAGIDGIEIVPGKGIMIAMNHRLLNNVINRCTM